MYPITAAFKNLLQFQGPLRPKSHVTIYKCLLNKSIAHWIHQKPTFTSFQKDVSIKEPTHSPVEKVYLFDNTECRINWSRIKIKLIDILYKARHIHM
jgi:hypothetical protein